MTMQPNAREQTIADYLVVIRRYKWLILATALVVPIAAYVVSAQQEKVYRASSDVLLNRQDLGSSLTGIPTQSTVTDPVRYARTQAQLARVPDVLGAAVESARVTNVEVSDLQASSDVSTSEETDILTFGVNDGDPGRAERLATAYAEAFVAYKLRIETASLQAARREINQRIAELREAGASNTDTYRQLVQQASSIRTLEFLQLPATVVRPADGAGQIAPTPRRNAILGVMLGLVLGVGAAFALNAFDRRIRQADEVEHELQIPLLAKLPTPRRGDAATILDRPPDETTESVARLRTAFDFTNTDLGAKLVMVTSAGPREGKSTTITNLAIALARTGRHVVLVDLDLRRPIITRLLHLPDGPGITDLASRHADLADVLQLVGVTPLRARITSIGGSESGQGRLEVVSAGRTRVDPAAFVESTGLTDALHKLRGYAEIVLVDAPPILATGDAMALTGKVDALLLVSRLGTLTSPTLQELARVLRRSPATVLGLVATGAEIDEGYSVYTVDEYYAETRVQPEAPPRAPVEVADVRSASSGSGRWTPRRGG
jgi:polysaccharide biosynthesis transport protein